MNIKEIVENQRKFFNTHITININYRIEHLKKLKQNIINFQDEILSSLNKDLGKPYIEGFMCEISLCLKEINYFLKNLKKLSKPKKVRGNIENFPSKSYYYYEPYGVTLIMCPWNYPFLLSMQPLIDSIASGNTVILKVGNDSQNTSNTLKKIIESTFSPEYVFMLSGDRTVNQDLLNQKFDYVLFTGSEKVGKIVMKSQSEFLTPVTLELGGKSPVIIDKTSNIALCAKRICFGKILNSGQTCVAPDYLIIDENLKDDFIKYFSIEINKQLGSEPLKNNAYGKIVNEKHFNRLNELLTDQKIILGGKSDKETLRIEPTLVDINNNLENKLMQEEIFGPILPIITYTNEEDIFNIIGDSTPLSLYYFGTNKTLQNKIISNIKFGGGCVNDTIMHLVTNMSFGGVGTSGMGSYHKEQGFLTFSHRKSILIKGKFEFNIRYRPYNEKKSKLIKKIMK